MTKHYNNRNADVDPYTKYKKPCTKCGEMFVIKFRGHYFCPMCLQVIETKMKITLTCTCKGCPIHGLGGK